MRRRRLILGALATLNQTERHGGKNALFSENTLRPAAVAPHIWTSRSNVLSRPGVEDKGGLY